MAPLRDDTAVLPIAGRALTTPSRSPSAACLAALDGVAERAPLTRAPPPRLPPAHRLYCGWCHGAIEDVGAGHVTQCANCGRGLAVPAYITVVCDRCGHASRIAPRKLAAERLCTTCGKTLTVGDLVLTPYRPHRQHHHYRNHPTNPYGDAAWAMLIIALTLVILVLSLTVLT